MVSKKGKIKLEKLSYFHAWQGIPDAVERMCSSRFTNTEEWTPNAFANHSINHAVIVLSAILIEGSLEAILKRVLFMKTDLKDDNFLERINNVEPNKRYHNLTSNIIYSYFKSMSRFTWQRYNSQFKMFFGSSVKDIFQSSGHEMLYKNTNSLFTLRNWLAHGENLSIKYIQDKEGARVEFHDKARDLASDLRGQDLYKENEPHYFNDYFLSNNVADFFRMTSMDFLKVVTNGINSMFIPYELATIVTQAKLKD